jgi:predicted transcriptional regulator
LGQKADELPYAKNLLWMVFANSRGGQNRIKIIFTLKKSPLNAHQLSKELGLNYRAIQHHISVLEKNNLVSHVGEKYGTTYFLSTFLEVHVKVFDEIVMSLYRGK